MQSTANISTRISSFRNVAAETRPNLGIHIDSRRRSRSLPAGCNSLLLNEFIGIRISAVPRANAPSIECLLLSL